jgi:hypothetical protein
MAARHGVDGLGPCQMRDRNNEAVGHCVVLGCRHFRRVLPFVGRECPPGIAAGGRGLEDIDECGSLKSFDGTKTLDLERSYKVSLTEKLPNDADKPERKVDETWSFDEEKERYTVSFADSSADYALVKPDDSSVCILAPGDAGAVNLRESWFARIEDE